MGPLQTVDGLLRTVVGLLQTVDGLPRTVVGLLQTVDGLLWTDVGPLQTVDCLLWTVDGLLQTVDCLQRPVRVRKWIGGDRGRRKAVAVRGWGIFSGLVDVRIERVFGCGVARRE